MLDKSGLVKANINIILMEENELSELWIEYDTEIAKTILKLKPQTEVEYRLAELQAKIEHKDLYEKILKKQDEVNNLGLLLEHKEEVLEQYEQFKKENGELIDLLDKLFGDD